VISQDREPKCGAVDPAVYPRKSRAAGQDSNRGDENSDGSTTIRSRLSGRLRQSSSSLSARQRNRKAPRPRPRDGRAPTQNGGWRRSSASPPSRSRRRRGASGSTQIPDVSGSFTPVAQESSRSRRRERGDSRRRAYEPGVDGKLSLYSGAIDHVKTNARRSQVTDTAFTRGFRKQGKGRQRHEPSCRTDPQQRHLRTVRGSNGRAFGHARRTLRRRSTTDGYAVTLLVDLLLQPRLMALTSLPCFRKRE